MYKLIALDVDGTLLNSRREITERTISAVDAAKAMGIKIVLASARPFYRLKPFINTLGLATDDQFTIAFNGGLVQSNTGSRILHSSVFTSAQVLELVTLGQNLGTVVFLYLSSGILSNADNESYRRRNPEVSFTVADFAEADLSEIRVYKVVFMNTPAETQRLRKKIPREFSGRFEISSSVPEFIEFVSKGITKSGALEHIGKELGILADEMIAFGDHDNDLPMLHSVGLSIAMGNATAEVKHSADFTTASNDDDGVAIAIETHVLR